MNNDPMLYINGERKPRSSLTNKELREQMFDVQARLWRMELAGDTGREYKALRNTQSLLDFAL